jgi:hypothetical protein
LLLCNKGKRRYRVTGRIVASSRAAFHDGITLVDHVTQVIANVARREVGATPGTLP